ncbi:sulfite exporter TauE/SafE family protein [Prosthecomicrobium sp. N25]|uniref:sulfite exporter TauE/SafE family protein n=1 Tax=Prosthecomicrobium sp. N25 TaxID=3129254 RepID=UPI0030777DD8
MLIAYAFLVVFVAGVLRGMTGFGYALMAAIALAAVFPPGLTTATVLIVELAITALMLRDGALRAAEPARLVPLSVGGVAGTVAGAALASALPAAWVKPALDAAVLASALVSLAHFRAPGLDRPWIGGLIAFLVGVLASAFAVGGPFLVVWFLAIGAAPASIRGNLTVFFGVVDVAAIVMRASTIGIPAEAWTTALLLLPPTLAGVFLGGRLFHKVDAAWWRRIAAWSIAGGAILSLGRSLVLRP